MELRVEETAATLRGRGGEETMGGDEADLWEGDLWR